MIRQRKRSNMSPLYERNWSHHLNTLKLEQIMISSFYSSSIVHKMGALPHEYSYTIRPSRPNQVSPTEQTNRPPGTSY